MSAEPYIQIGARVKPEVYDIIRRLVRNGSYVSQSKVLEDAVLRLDDALTPPKLST